MKQKHTINSLLQQHFTNIHPQYLKSKIISYPNHKIIFQQGDTINHIYLIIKGLTQFTFNDKNILIPQNTIIGDYQSLIKTQIRNTMLIAIKNVQLLQLPINSFHNIKPEFENNKIFISKCLNIQDHFQQYLLNKLFQLKNTTRGQKINLITQNQQNHIAIIKNGTFNIQKPLKIAKIQQFNLQIQKQFVISQINSENIIQDNIICYSPQGSIFICYHQYYQNLIQNFENLSNIFTTIQHQKQFRKQRQKSIKNMCKPKSILINSILPSIFQTSTPKNQNSKNKKIQTQKQQNTQFYDKNHFFIQISNNNKITTKPTNSNLSLIPLTKIHKFNISSQQKPISLKQIKSPKKQKNKKQQENSRYKTQQQIPQIFNSKFKRKMFIKTNNPFHHFKSKQIWFDQLQTIENHQKSYEVEIKSQRTFNKKQKYFQKLKIQ